MDDTGARMASKCKHNLPEENGKRNAMRNKALQHGCWLAAGGSRQMRPLKKHAGTQCYARNQKLSGLKRTDARRTQKGARNRLFAKTCRRKAKAFETKHGC